MTIEDLKDELATLTEAYFTEANVAWDRTNKVMPKVALVCMDLGVMKRSYQSVNEVTEGGEEDTYIETKNTAVTIPWTVEVFTHGKKCTVDGRTYFKNTALDEINAFIDYMESDVVMDTCNSHNIVAVITGDITDTTAVHDNDYEYRAKVEFMVSFMLTSSKNIDIIEQAEIEEEEYE